MSTLLRDTAAALRQAGIENPGLEARMLLAHAAGLSMGALPPETVDAARLDALVARRVAREPMALILGHTGFWTLDLAVSRDTLIPRPDSETLIEAALEALPDRPGVRHVLDLGTGTGCLLLAALSEFPAAWGLGVDLNPAAAALARANATRNHLAPRSAFLAADWDAPLAGRFDLILSNPPYIETADIPALMPEVRAWEPSRALDGGKDGLDAYRHLASRLPGLLAEGGIAVLELGQGQAEPVSNLARAAGLTVQALRHDLGGIARALVLSTGQDEFSFGSAARRG